MSSSPAVAGATGPFTGDREQLRVAAPYVVLILALQIALALVLVLAAG